MFICEVTCECGNNVNVHATDSKRYFWAECVHCGLFFRDTSKRGIVANIKQHPSLAEIDS